MTRFTHTQPTSDQLVAILIAGLEREFGQGADEGLAAHLLAAEECDFLWEARHAERWLGQYQGDGQDEQELDRITILGAIDGRWFVATVIVDGEGQAHALLGRRDFECADLARQAFDRAR